jgi:hypothetical protein
VIECDETSILHKVVGHLRPPFADPYKRCAALTKAAFSSAEMVKHTRTKLNVCDETSIRPGGPFNVGWDIKDLVLPKLM